MKLGDNGVAFFVEEITDDQDDIPLHLVTSPLPQEIDETAEVVVVCRDMCKINIQLTRNFINNTPDAVSFGRNIFVFR
jgi:phosphatidate phosphatase PAH1